MLAYFRAKWRLLFIYTMLHKYGRRAHDFLGVFLLIHFSTLRGVFNKTIIPVVIPVALVECEMVIANSAPRWLYSISCPATLME